MQSLNKSLRLLLLGAGALCARPGFSEPRLIAPVDVFPSDTIYTNFRTPSIVTAADGSLVAIAEGRDFDEPGVGTSDLDIVSRRSIDGGLSWSPLNVVDTWTGGSSSNPTTVVDRDTGRIFTLFNRWEGYNGTVTSQPGTTNNTAWLRYSDDHGQTWSAPRDITTSVKDYNNWPTVSFGPGSGIQASNGRLIIPSARWQNGWQVYAAYSNDHGNSWTRGQLAPGGNLAGENQMVQLANGSILFEARPNTASGTRLESVSSNGGLTWSTPTNGQLGPDVATAVERYSLISAGSDQNRLVFTSPRGPDRNDLVIRASYNESTNWINERLLYDGYSGYSDITTMTDGSIGVLFETNEARSITFVKLNREWIEPPQRLKAYDGFRYNTPTLSTKNGGLLWNSGWAGTPTLTGSPTVKIENSDLQQANYPFALENKRRVVFDHGGTMARALPESIDLNSSSPYYFSLLARQDELGSETDGSAEAFDISLYAGAVKLAGFGVRGNESFYSDLPGASANSAAGAMDKDVPYYLVGKLVPQDNSNSANRDRMYVKAFRSGDAVPATEDLMGWTLIGTSGVNSSSVLDRIVIKGGAASVWVMDELRFGTSFGSVVSNVLQYRWNVDADGLWTTQTNWIDGSPMEASAIAEFAAAITSPKTVTLNAPRTAGGLRFDSAFRYTVEGAGTLTLDAISGNTSINVVTGTHTLSTPLKLLDATDIAVAADAALQLTRTLTSSTITISKSGAGLLAIPQMISDQLSISSGIVKLDPKVIPNDPAQITSIAKLTITGGQLDITNNRVELGYANAGSLDAVRSLLRSGYADGSLTGNGIVSTAAQIDGLAIGYVSSEVENTIRLQLALPADTNLDGRVNTIDFNVLAGSFGQAGDSTWMLGDFNYDAMIDSADFTIFVANHGRIMPVNGSLGTTVPEPAALMLFAATLLFLSQRGKS